MLLDPLHGRPLLSQGLEQPNPVAEKSNPTQHGLTWTLGTRLSAWISLGETFSRQQQVLYGTLPWSGILLLDVWRAVGPGAVVLGTLAIL